MLRRIGRLAAQSFVTPRRAGAHRRGRRMLAAIFGDCGGLPEDMLVSGRRMLP